MRERERDLTNMIDHQAAIAKAACRAAEVVYPVRRELRELSEGHGSRVLTDVHVRRSKHKQRKRACGGHCGLQQHPPCCMHLAGAHQPPQNDNSPQPRTRPRSPAASHGSSRTHHPAIHYNKLRNCGITFTPNITKTARMEIISSNKTYKDTYTTNLISFT